MKKFRAVTLAGAVILVSGLASATAIGMGEANTAGSVLVNSSGIFFSNFIPTSPNNGSYTGTTSVTQNNLAGLPTLTPNLASWTTFTGPAGGPIIFDLQTLDPGFGSLAGCGSNAVGNTCTPSAASGITITQVTAGSVSISLVGHGIAYTGTSGTGSTPTIVSFSSQNNVPGTISGILAAVASGNGFSNSVSATFDSTPSSSVPEPMTLSMIGIGLLGIGLIRRRQQN